MHPAGRTGYPAVMCPGVELPARPARASAAVARGADRGWCPRFPYQGPYDRGAVLLLISWRPTPLRRPSLELLRRALRESTAALAWALATHPRYHGLNPIAPGPHQRYTSGTARIQRFRRRGHQMTRLVRRVRSPPEKTLVPPRGGPRRVILARRGPRLFTLSMWSGRRRLKRPWRRLRLDKPLCRRHADLGWEGLPGPGWPRDELAAITLPENASRFYTSTHHYPAKRSGTRAEEVQGGVVTCAGACRTRTEEISLRRLPPSGAELRWLPDGRWSMSGVPPPRNPGWETAQDSPAKRSIPIRGESASYWIDAGRPLNAGSRAAQLDAPALRRAGAASAQWAGPGRSRGSARPPALRGIGVTRSAGDVTCM